MPRRTYDDSQREAALEAVKEHGLADAWRLTGIPKPTLAMWARHAGLQTDGVEKTRAATLAAAARADQLRAEIRLKLLEKASDLLDRMDSEHIEFKNSAKEIREVVYPIAPAGAVQHYATSVGILIDKYRLEVGEATNRTESRDLTSQLTDDELDAAIREAEEALRRATEAQDGRAPSEEPRV